MTTSNKILIGTLCAIALAAILIVWFLWPKSAPVEPGEVADATATTSANQTVPEPDKPKGLPPEIPFVLPEGAVAIDEYTFIENGLVNFISITGKTPLTIPNSDAKTFKRLTDVMTYPGSAIVNDCGAAGRYTFYGDKKQVYFYEFWRTSQFRSSTITVVKNSSIDNFELVDPRHIRNSVGTLALTYTKTASSTCSFALTPQ